MDFQDGWVLTLPNNALIPLVTYVWRIFSFFLNAHSYVHCHNRNIPYLTAHYRYVYLLKNIVYILRTVISSSKYFSQ